MYNLINNQPNEDYYEYYTIQKGDNLYQIARMYNVNLNLLAALNGIDINEYIYPNQVIILPKKGYSYYLTKDGDTLSIVANTFDTDILNLINENKTIYLREGQLIVHKEK